MAKKKGCNIITTEKDYFKIKKYNLNEIRYLKMSVEIIEKNKLINRIKKLYDKNI